MSQSHTPPLPSAQDLVADQVERNLVATDRFFGWLLANQGILLSMVALWQARSEPGLRPWLMLAITAAFVVTPVLLVRRLAGRGITRHAVAAAQMLLGVLLCLWSNHRPEALFHA